MSRTFILLVTILAWATAFTPMTQAVSLEIEDITLSPPRLTIRSEVGVTNVIEYADLLATNQWQALTNLT